MYFRVTGTFKNCVVKAVSGGKVLMERKRKIAVPGEMETLLLLDKALKEASGEITVYLEEQ
jgi:hypothetical protein